MMHKRLPVPSKRVLIILAWSGGILAALLIMSMMFVVANLSSDYNSLEDEAKVSQSDRDDLRRSLVEQEQSLAEANRRLKEVGEAPVPSPPVPTTNDKSGDDFILIPGPAGLDGADGVDGVDGRRGQRGLQGLMGPPGPSGINGIDGTDGIDGRDGADAPCLSTPEGCKGEKGDKGDSAYPFTFVFTVPGNGINSPDRTYTCNITGPETITCSVSP